MARRSSRLSRSAPSVSAATPASTSASTSSPPSSRTISRTTLPQTPSLPSPHSKPEPIAGKISSHGPPAANPAANQSQRLSTLSHPRNSPSLLHPPVKPLTSTSPTPQNPSPSEHVPASRSDTLQISPGFVGSSTTSVSSPAAPTS